ncbi:MAG: hypothetical protein RR050_01870, partial [Bacilli bacterium]
YINITINSTRGQQFAVIVGGIGENGYLGPHIAKGGYNGGQNGTPAGRSKGGTGTGGGGGGATSLVVNSINYAMANGGGGGGGGTDGGYFRYKSGPFIGETKCGGCRDRNEGAAGTKGGDGGGGTKGGAQASFTCLSDGNDGEHGSYYYNSSYVTLVSGQVGGKSGNGYAKITYIG